MAGASSQLDIYPIRTLSCSSYGSKVESRVAESVMRFQNATQGATSLEQAKVRQARSATQSKRPARPVAHDTLARRFPEKFESLWTWIRTTE